MLDELRITSDTVLQQLSTESELDRLYNFLVADTQVICSQRPFDKSEFDKTIKPLLNHPHISIWWWANEHVIVGSMILVKRRTSLYAIGLSFHKDFKLMNNIEQLIADGRQLLNTYDVTFIVFCVDATSPQIAQFDEYFTRYEGPLEPQPGTIAYEIRV